MVLSLLSLHSAYSQDRGRLDLVKQNNDKLEWIKLFNTWYDKNKDHINERNSNPETGKWWYRHKNLRRASVMIKRAIPDMFRFLEYPKIPISTNNIESYFGHLKDTLSIHTGLSHKNRRAFIQWYLHLKNKNRT